MEQYYDRPTQVIFIEEDNLMQGPKEVRWDTGIAYGDSVICNCCGGVIPLDEIAYIFEFDEWYDYGRDKMMNALDLSLINQIQKEIEETYDWLEEDRP